MKKSAAYWLLTTGLVLIALMAGFFIGRNCAPSPIIVSKLPTQSHTSPRININTATFEELQTLPGIGQVIAQRIIEYRNANGPFEKISDLTLVEGIGLDTLEKLTDYATTEEESYENTGC